MGQRPSSSKQGAQALSADTTAPTNDSSSKKKEAWDIEELSGYRLDSIKYEQQLCDAIGAYWDEIFLSDFEADADEDKADVADQATANIFADGTHYASSDNYQLTEKVIFGPTKNKRKKNLTYFTDDVYDEWSWTFFLDGYSNIFEKQCAYQPLHQRAIYHLKQHFDALDRQQYATLFEHRDSQTLAQNEWHELLWLFIGYQFNKLYRTASDHFMGDTQIMQQFLQRLSILFKVILIAYNYEYEQYKKVVNHYMKPVLANIDKPVLEYALDIIRRKKLNSHECKNEEKYMQNIYHSIVTRMEGARPYLEENGIYMKKKL